MFYVYILYSIKLNQYYVGYTSDLHKRLQEHNSGISKYTSKANDWQLCFQEEFFNREDAMQREKEIKRKKSRKYIEGILEHNK